MGLEDVDWSNVAQDRNKWEDLVNTTLTETAGFRGTLIQGLSLKEL